MQKHARWRRAEGGGGPRTYKILTMISVDQYVTWLPPSFVLVVLIERWKPPPPPPPLTYSVVSVSNQDCLHFVLSGTKWHEWPVTHSLTPVCVQLQSVPTHCVPLQYTRRHYTRGHFSYFVDFLLIRSTDGAIPLCTLHACN